LVIHPLHTEGKPATTNIFEYYEIVSKMFVSENEGFLFYIKYALDKEFNVRKRYVEWDNANQ